MTRSLPLALLIALLPALAWADSPLGFDVPKGWKVEQPKSKMRSHQYHVPRTEGDERDAKVIVYFFGKQQGGGVEANIERWKKQIKRGEGDPEAKRSERKCGAFKATFFDQTGTYTQPSFRPNAPKAKPLPGTRIINVVLPTPEGTFFVRFIGPKKTVEKQHKSFLAFMDSAAIGKKNPPPEKKPASRPTSRPN
jgi:hypothetical protein